ncbi:hypothetical protein MMPV_001133 [Pyropia vietnamensis]
MAVAAPLSRPPPFTRTQTVRLGALTLTATLTTTNTTPAVGGRGEDSLRLDLAVTPPAPALPPATTLTLHWGVVPAAATTTAPIDTTTYTPPPASMIPANSAVRPDKASVRTPFGPDGTLCLVVPMADAPGGGVLLLATAVANDPGGGPQSDVWFKGDGGRAAFVSTAEALRGGGLPVEGEGEGERGGVDPPRVTDAAGSVAEREAGARQLAEAAWLEEAAYAAAAAAAASEADGCNAGGDGGNSLPPPAPHTAAVAAAVAAASAGRDVRSRLDCEWGDVGAASLVAFAPVNVAAAAPDGDISNGGGGGRSGRDGDGDSGDDDSSDVPSTLVDVYMVAAMAPAGTPVILHWGVAVGGCSGWSAPPPASWPPHTVAAADGLAVDTTLLPIPGLADDRVVGATISGLPPSATTLWGVLHLPAAPAERQWLHNPAGGGDLALPLVAPGALPGAEAAATLPAAVRAVVDVIVEREVRWDSWSLMHRFSLAGELAAGPTVGTSPAGWGVLVAWLRYSQLRALTWQRQFHTPPRHLSHVQMELVARAAGVARRHPPLRWLTRAVLAAVGRGGAGDLGQRIRDDILAILRHHRPWKRGSLMEDWHQKLHNNTTADDVIIAEAFLAGWDAPHASDRVGAFWATLAAGGLSAADIATYEQPLIHSPDDSWPEHARGGVVRDLRRYLGLLKAVHGGEDLAEVADRVRGGLDDRTREAVDNALAIRARGGGRGDLAALGDLLVAIVAARTALAAHTAEPYHDDARVRDLLYLDLALDAAARLAVEGASPPTAADDGPYTLAAHVRVLRAAAAGLALSEAGLPSAAAARDVAGTLDGVAARLAANGPTVDVGLRVAAATMAASALLGQIVDRHTELLGSPAAAIGSACGIDSTVVATFVETFVRGGPAFALSTCIRRAAPVVRAVAATGPWTVVAPVSGTTVGPLLAVAALSSLDGTRLASGTVLVADAVGGDEDVPDGTAHVVAAEAVDVLSHLAVRARNEGHGLVICHDEDRYAALRAMHGGVVRAWQGGGAFHVELLEGRRGK